MTFEFSTNAPKPNSELIHTYKILPHLYQPFKRQSHKMVKHTQAICRQFPEELFECV